MRSAVDEGLITEQDYLRIKDGILVETGSKKASPPSRGRAETPREAALRGLHGDSNAPAASRRLDMTSVAVPPGIAPRLLGPMDAYPQPPMSAKAAAHILPPSDDFQMGAGASRASWPAPQPQGHTGGRSHKPGYEAGPANGGGASHFDSSGDEGEITARRGPAARARPSGFADSPAAVRIAEKWRTSVASGAPPAAPPAPVPPRHEGPGDRKGASERRKLRLLAEAHKSAVDGDLERLQKRLRSGEVHVSDRCTTAHVGPDGKVTYAPAGGQTMLHAAASAGRREVCELLLHYGADTHTLDDSGRTADAVAMDAGFVALAHMLLPTPRPPPKPAPSSPPSPPPPQPPALSPEPMTPPPLRHEREEHGHERLVVDHDDRWRETAMLSPDPPGPTPAPPHLDEPVDSPPHREEKVRAEAAYRVPETADPSPPPASLDQESSLISMPPPPESPPADAVIASAATLSPSPAMSLSPDPGPPPVESVAPAPAVEVTEKATAPPPSPFAIEVPSPNFLSLQHNPPTTDAPFASIVAPEARPQPQASLALDHPPVAPAAHLVPQPSALQEVHHYAQPPLLSVPENAAPAMLPTHIAAHLAPPSTADVLQAQAQAAAQAAAAHAGAQAKAAAVAAAAAQDAAAVEARRFDDQMRQKREVRASVVIPARIPNAFVEWPEKNRSYTTPAIAERVREELFIYQTANTQTSEAIVPTRLPLAMHADCTTRSTDPATPNPTPIPG